ncbi:hypothetical protein PLICRDRAFT_111654 [Plicaturopsis crispa FD-325 SS-3]|nr:hypothetical protein PLICRDRAFT_111654 [Plicaturopsis crispa FD-325 SS-3]
MSSLLTTPLSLYSLPLAWFAAYWPMNMKLRALKSTIGYNNVNPRANLDRLAGKEGISPEFAARIARMEGAHQNGNEMLPVWIGAILAGNQAGLDAWTLNVASVIFLTLRVLYNYVYINKSGGLRTLVWVLGMIVPMTLYVKAGNKARLGL